MFAREGDAGGSGGSAARAGVRSIRPVGWVSWVTARGARRVTRAVGGTLRSRALPHRDRGESDFHAGNSIVTVRAVSTQIKAL